MVSLNRLSWFVLTFGVTLVVLSFVYPIITPSFTPIADLNYGDYKGVMVNCYDSIDVRIQPRHDEVFSTYLMDSANGLLALEEGSLENVTLLRQVLNRTLLIEHWTVPAPGWYSILVTPSNNETIQFIYFECVQQTPNLRALLAGGILAVISPPWVFKILRNRIKKIKHRP